MIRNVHVRRLPVQACEVRAALEQLATDVDRVWPRRDWPALRLDAGLRVGSAGGHGPIRYRVSKVDAMSIEFEFAPSTGFRGTHRFDVRADGLASVVSHTIEMRAGIAARVRWAVAIKWLHNALIEDLLDNLTHVVGAQPRSLARWSPYVRVLRRTFRRPESIRRELGPRDVVQHDVEVVMVGR